MVKAAKAACALMPRALCDTSRSRVRCTKAAARRSARSQHQMKAARSVTAPMASPQRGTQRSDAHCAIEICADSKRHAPQTRSQRKNQDAGAVLDVKSKRHEAASALIARNPIDIKK
eukprot:gene16063-biopygen11437